MDDQKQIVITGIFALIAGALPSLLSGVFNRFKQRSSSVLDMAESASTQAQTALLLNAPLIERINELTARLDEVRNQLKVALARIIEVEAENARLACENSQLTANLKAALEASSGTLLHGED